MSNLILRLAGAALLVAVSAPAAAQQAIPAAQVQQLIDTLKQRNEQVRTLSERVRELEATAARADASVARLAAAENAMRVASRKNQELVTLGEAIIADYEKLGLHKRIAASEPLTGLYRVRLENKLEEYRAEIAQLGFYPEKEMEPQPPAAAPPAPAPAPQ
jgi:ribosome-binding ATPase YchF (GTP1/OBG family)